MSSSMAAVATATAILGVEMQGQDAHCDAAHDVISQLVVTVAEANVLEEIADAALALLLGFSFGLGLWSGAGGLILLFFHRFFTFQGRSIAV